MKKENVSLKVGNMLSNEIVKKVTNVCLLFNTNFESEKAAKDNVTKWLKKHVEGAKGDELNTPVARAYAAKVEADKEYQKQVSFFVNDKFFADVIVDNMIREISTFEGCEFFTPEYLDKLGIYKIPNGVILDTLQKCRSFVSSLYATALSEYKKEIKDGGGIEIIFARVKEIISFNDSQFVATKFANMSILRKYELLYSVLENCTKSEKVAIWAKLGVNFNVAAKGGKGSTKVLEEIEIEKYVPLKNKVDINFYHKYATNAVSLSKAEAAEVMGKPITPLKGAKGSTKPKSAKGSK
nr:MAG TPA: hypothetical protein [Caudoviricetes sp.]